MRVFFLLVNVLPGWNCSAPQRQIVVGFFYDFWIVNFSTGRSSHAVEAHSSLSVFLSFAKNTNVWLKWRDKLFTVESLNVGRKYTFMPWDAYSPVLIVGLL